MTLKNTEDVLILIRLIFMMMLSNTHLSEGDIRLKRYIQHVAEYKLDKDIL